MFLTLNKLCVAFLVHLLCNTSALFACLVFLCLFTCSNLTTEGFLILPFCRWVSLSTPICKSTGPGGLACSRFISSFSTPCSIPFLGPAPTAWTTVLAWVYLLLGVFLSSIWYNTLLCPLGRMFSQLCQTLSNLKKNLLCLLTQYAGAASIFNFQ